MKKNKDLQEGVKSLQDESGKLAESDALRKAKEMYEKAKVRGSKKNKRMCIWILTTTIIRPNKVNKTCVFVKLLKRSRKLQAKWENP